MEGQQLRTTGDTVLVYLPEPGEEHLVVGGVRLYFDASWHRLENKRLRGVVVAVPERVGESYLLARGQRRVAVSAIQDRLAVGDAVYVDWTVSEAHGRVQGADFELPGVGGVYRATLNQVVARVREENGEAVLEPFGSYVLCRPVWPDDVQAVEVPGFPGVVRLRVSASGLTMGTEEVPAIAYQGEVVHVGLPLRGQPGRVRVGQRVVFDKRQCGKEAQPMKLKLGEEEFLCIRQEYILAAWEEGEVPEPAAAEMVPWGYNFDPEIICQVFQRLGVSPDLNAFIRAFSADGRLMVGKVNVVAEVERLGGVTPNGPGRIDGEQSLPPSMVADNARYQRDRHLVTTCCGADHIHARAEDGSAVVDFCACCRQVAHLVPQKEFSRNQSAA